MMQNEDSKKPIIVDSKNKQINKKNIWNNNKKKSANLKN